MSQRRRDTLPTSHRRVPGQPSGRGPSGAQARRTSRREREARQRRMLYWGMGIAGGLIILILGAFSVNEYWLKPRHVLATVDGTDIRRRDYWKFRSVELVDQANQYAQIANSPFIEDSQRQQYVTLAQSTSAQVDDVWGSTDRNDETLQRMIDDQVYLKNLDELGLSISDQDVQDYIDQRFQPADAPIFTPTPSPTLIPARAAWATETAVALENPDGLTPTAGAASPVASPAASPDSPASPVPSASIAPMAGASPISPAAPVSVASPSGVVLEASPQGSPVAATPEATPELSPTPNQEQARQTAEAQFADYRDNVFDRAHMSRGDYERLIVRPAVARQKIDDRLTADLGQTAEQVHAAHILVDTKDLADAIYQQVAQEGADFGQAARDQSTDSSTAPNGGDLGWFTRGQMVDAFEEVAFTTPPGQISTPFETEFGWHVVQVIEHEQDRPMTDEQITAVRQGVIDDWLATTKEATDISSEVEPSPTPAAQQFVPPADAPPLPTPTVEPPLTSPVANPAAAAGTEP